MTPFTKWQATRNTVLFRATFQCGKQNNKLKIETDGKKGGDSWGKFHWVGARPGWLHWLTLRAGCRVLALLLFFKPLHILTCSFICKKYFTRWQIEKILVLTASWLSSFQGWGGILLAWTFAPLLHPPLESQRQLPLPLWGTSPLPQGPQSQKAPQLARLALGQHLLGPCSACPWTALNMRQ